jgi:hypothetical protein
MPVITQNQIDHWFMFHSPTPEQQKKYAALRAKAKEFAELIVVVCPEGDDKMYAIRHIRETVMLANQSIACDVAE